MFSSSFLLLLLFAVVGEAIIDEDEGSMEHFLDIPNANGFNLTLLVRKWRRVEDGFSVLDLSGRSFRCVCVDLHHHKYFNDL